MNRTRTYPEQPVCIPFFCECQIYNRNRRWRGFGIVVEHKLEIDVKRGREYTRWTYWTESTLPLPLNSNFRERADPFPILSLPRSRLISAHCHKGFSCFITITIRTGRSSCQSQSIKASCIANNRRRGKYSTICTFPTFTYRLLYPSSTDSLCLDPASSRFTRRLLSPCPPPLLLAQPRPHRHLTRLSSKAHLS